METGLVDPTGYPIGQLYLMLRFEARRRKINLFSDEFRNNRELLLDLGVSEKRIRTVTPQLFTTRFNAEYKGIRIDILEGTNMPRALEG